MDLDWQIAVFGQNEAARIGECVASIARAAMARRTLVTVLLNGCTDESSHVAMRAAREASLSIDIWRIAHADKANAINRFFHELRVPARYYCCVDAYAVIGADTLAGFERCLDSRPDINLAASIPINGRSQRRTSEKMLVAGGVATGQLYAPSPNFLNRLANRGLRLPIGLYRGDGLLGSMAAHDLDALGKPWDSDRLPRVAEATFGIDPISLLSPADIRRHFRRKVRQMRGLLENAAIKRVIYSGGYEALPEYADDMIAAFIQERGMVRVDVFDRPFMAAALRQHRRARRPSSGRLATERTEALRQGKA